MNRSSAEAQGGQIMADGTNYNSRTIAIGIAAVIIVVLVIAWFAGAFQGLLEQPTTQVPETETTTPEPETTEPEAEEPAQQQ
jgi:predicted metalloprotease